MIKNKKIKKKKIKRSKDQKIKRSKDKYNLLFFSSFIFITNIITSFYKKYYFYTFFFICLTITSLIFHYNSNIYTNILDKLSIFAIISYGALILYKNMSLIKYKKIILIIFSFLLVLLFFTYGFFTKKYCYDKNKCISDKYHCLLHFISSFGHHLIIFL